MAGIYGALVGSILTLAVCLVLSFPMGVATAVYLEEFAPKNRITEIIEININNLAAVPSVVFGILSTIFIGISACRGQSADRRGGAGADDPADNHHFIACRHPCGAAKHS